MADGGADFRVNINSEAHTEGFTQVIEAAKKMAEVLGVTLGLEGLKIAVEETVKAFGNQQAAMAATEGVLQSTGSSAGVTAEEINAFSEATSKSTQYSAVQAQEMQNLELTFTNIGKDVFPAASKSILDMAQFMHMDLRQATIEVGKALQDPITGMANLRREGVMLSASQQETVKGLVNTGQTAKAQQIVIGELEHEFGNAAEMYGKTVPGQIAIMNNSFESVKEKIGGLLSTALIPMMSGFSNFVSKNQEAILTIGGTIVVVGLAAAALVGLSMGIGALTTAVAALNIAMLPQIALWVAFAAILAYAVYPAIKGVMEQMGQTAKIDEHTHAMQATTDATDNLTKSGMRLQEQLKSIGEQMDKENTNFRENLADMINAAEQKVTDLKQSLLEENNAFTDNERDKLEKYNDAISGMTESRDRFLEDNKKTLTRENEQYKDAYDKKLAEYTKKIELEREKGTEVSALMVKDLQRSEAEELANLTESHTNKLADLQTSLSREEQDYAKHTDTTKEQYTKDTTNAQTQHDKKVEATSDALAKQQNMLDRHATEVMQVRGIVALDEIDKLNRAHAEAIKSYADQADKARQSAGEQQGAISDGLTKQIAASKNIGGQIGQGIVDGIGQGFSNSWHNFTDNFHLAVSGLQSLLLSGDMGNEIGNDRRLVDPSKGNAFSKLLGMVEGNKAAGGAVQAGSMYQINENGQEYFQPSTSGNIMPIGAGGGGGGGVTITIQGDLNVDSEQRKNDLIREIAFLMGRQGQLALNGGL